MAEPPLGIYLPAREGSSPCRHEESYVYVYKQGGKGTGFVVERVVEGGEKREKRERVTVPGRTR